MTKLISAIIIIILLCSASLFAGSVSLSWERPVRNADGTSLEDLAGFKVYYGTRSGEYSDSVYIGNVTTYKADDLSSGETYYFSVTARDTSGNESGYSPEVKVEIPACAPSPVYPQHNQKGLGETIQFVWEMCPDPNDSVMTRLTVCEDAQLTAGCIGETHTASILNDSPGRSAAGFHAGLLCFGIISFLPFSGKGRRIMSVLVVAAAVTGLLFMVSCGGGSGGGGDAGNGNSISSGSGARTGSGSSGGSEDDDSVSPQTGSGTRLSSVVSGLRPGTTYHWQVTATDGMGNETHSPVWSFETAL